VLHKFYKNLGATPNSRCQKDNIEHIIYWLTYLKWSVKLLSSGDFCLVYVKWCTFLRKESAIILLRILRAIIQNLVTWLLRCLAFVHPCLWHVRFCTDIYLFLIMVSWLLLFQTMIKLNFLASVDHGKETDSIQKWSLT
jgi:hypothetical protein